MRLWREPSHILQLPVQKNPLFPAHHPGKVDTTKHLFGSINLEIKPFLSSGDTYFSYFDPTSAEGFRKSLDALEAYILDEGPFDGVIAFSQGALLTSTLLARKEKNDSQAEQDRVMKSPFKCAVFFSGGVPVAYGALLRGEFRAMAFATEGEIISIPTANVWGSKDALWPGRALALSEMCSSNVRTVYIHDGGHEVPGSKSKAAVTGVVHAIRKTIDRALFANWKLYILPFSLLVMIIESNPHQNYRITGLINSSESLPPYDYSAFIFNSWYAVVVR